MNASMNFEIKFSKQQRLKKPFKKMTPNAKYLKQQILNSMQNFSF